MARSANHCPTYFFDHEQPLAPTFSHGPHAEIPTKKMRTFLVVPYQRVMLWFPVVCMLSFLATDGTGQAVNWWFSLIERDMKNRRQFTTVRDPADIPGNSNQQATLRKISYVKREKLIRRN